MRARRWIPWMDVRLPGTRETIVLTTLAAVLLAGCASSRREGGSLLSEASREASRSARHKDDDRRDEPKKKVLHAAREARRHPEPTPVVVVVEGEEDRAPRYRTREEPEATPPTYYVRLSGGGGGSDSPAFEGWSSVNLEAGVVEDGTDGRLMGGLELGVSPVRQSGYGTGGLHNVLELTAGGNLRFYKTPPRKGPAPYALAGFRAGLLRWDYAARLPVEDEWGDVSWVGSDFVNSWTPYVGAGIDLFRSGQTSMGASVAAGVKVFSDYTNEGFRNDLFETAGFVEMRVDLTWLSR
jgi:hypothetical protein